MVDFSGIAGIHPLWLIILGLGVGMMSGLLGVGGGVLITPALHVLGMSMPTAVATSLTQMVGTSLSGSYKHYRQDNVRIPLALMYGIPGMLGVSLGKTLLSRWSSGEADRILSFLYLATMTVLSLSMLRKIYGPAAPLGVKRPRKIWGPRFRLSGTDTDIAWIPNLAIGTGIGLLSSLTGLGGGFFYIPALMHLTGSTMKQAVGTSLATVFLSSLFGAVVYGAAGVSNIPAAFLLMSGSVVGAQMGAVAAHRIQNRGLERLFLLLILAALLSMIAQRFDYSLAANVILFGTGISVMCIALMLVFCADRMSS